MWAAGAGKHVMQQSHQEAARLPVSHSRAEPHLPTLGTSQSPKEDSPEQGDSCGDNGWRAVGCSGCSWQTQGVCGPRQPEFGLRIRMKGPVPRCLSLGSGLPHLPRPSQAERAPGSRGDEPWKGSPRKHDSPPEDRQLSLSVTRMFLSMATECLACPPGHFCGTSGLTVPSGPCSSGYFCLAGVTSPTPTGRRPQDVSGPCIGQMPRCRWAFW